MRVEAMLPLHNWRETGRAARAAEAVGYDSVSSAEMAHDPLTPLAFAALATERVRLSTGIVVAFPRSPTVLASNAWDLQMHSQGGFSLGRDRSRFEIWGGGFLAAGTYKEIVERIEERFGGLVDVITIVFPPNTPSELQGEILQDVRRIPSPFLGHSKDW
jgi:alkanesulfonate monooxygenase SsuD/methylene tetrahydromethanopterin reductase-like flavin-dependent oxidoreductase (luciferase family)